MLILGHRGASEYAPENTLPAFEIAMRQGADGIECDIVQVEEQSVLIHDLRLERTTDGHGYVYEHSLADLKKLNAGNENTIPTLDELFSCLPDKAWCNLELKYLHNPKRWCDELIALLEQYPQFKQNVVVSSFKHKWLMIVKQAIPWIKIGFLIAHYPQNLDDTFASYDGYSINVDLNVLDQQLVDAIHKQGMQAWVYTVDTVDDMKLCKRLNVDGIFTNCPDIARAIY